MEPSRAMTASLTTEAAMRTQYVQGTAAVIAALVTAVGALSGCASHGAKQSDERADWVIGIHWTLLSVATNAAKPAPVSAAPNTWLEISSNYELSGRDGCSAFQADGH